MSNKPSSLRSVPSSSSIASAVSLARRPPTRARSRTVTGSPPVHIIAETPVSELPYLDSSPLRESFPLHNPESLSSLDILPARQPRSPHRLDDDFRTSTTPSSQGLDLQTAEATMVEHLPSPNLGKPLKANAHAELVSGRPVFHHHSGYRPPPSAFSRDPAFTPNVRDSVSTHQSGVSSSLYPLSTSTASGPESPPSPRSMVEPLHHLDDYYDGAEIREVKGFDGDDVAYRLQLLVKNNYFLPPAHSKPSAADFAAFDASSGKKQSKSSAPAFLDLFRAVKPKSKPSTPAGSPNPEAAPPMLRTTADSISTGQLLRPPQRPRAGSNAAPTSPRPASRGRVVVVREKMADIAVAAKQAEQDLKSKGVNFQQVMQPLNGGVDEVIDPTDAVDVPLPSASYPFAVQASALHGLGVADSVGAALLADRLPPKSSNISSSYDIDDDWRKNLLHDAVHHSLNNTPDASTFSHMLGASTPVVSRFRSHSNAPTPTHSRRTARSDLEDVNHALAKLEGTREPKPRLKTQGYPKGQTRKPPSLDLVRVSNTSSVPARVETPTGPMTPLAPPPRNKFTINVQSHSQTDLPTTIHVSEDNRPSISASRHTLRKAQSSPSLNDRFVMTPPPVPSPLARSYISMANPSYETVNIAGREGSFTSASFYSEDEFDEGGGPRHSLALSAVHGRPSLSTYSQESLSPSTSAFQDALNHGGSYYSGSAYSSRASLDQYPPQRRAMPRDSVSSPPPRMSSSLAHVALPPPPRSANHPYLQHRRFLRTPSNASSTTELGSIVSQDVDAGDTLRFDEPEPTSPPLAALEAPSDSPVHSPVPLTLDIPRHHVPPPTIHSAGPTSDTSFFDSIQAQPNAMDDLDDSSDESDAEPENSPLPPPSPVVRPRAPSTVSAQTAPSPASRSPLMRLGNHSAPYVTKQPNLSKIQLQGIGNVPPKAQFFADRKASDSGPSGPPSAYDFIRIAQEGGNGGGGGSIVGKPSRSRPKTSASTQSAEPAVPSWQPNPKAQESLRKLDGMLLQHMETEKDTIKRIATTAKQTNIAKSVHSVS
ncbi:hypothetical protein FA15DRAFT_754509 [Coprinopsis marcescibilis]|uniref:Uncharacterized protein n=1 Tax=Coprinopsis marcescibilis TaxID=230819 RepID=A0A5C3L2G1_COPMA|nr:hypothetical protein FA15DRAFT_754509 [Coprinopsis marcescibilis]